MDRLSELGTARGFAERRVARAEVELADAKKELGQRIGEYIDYMKLHPPGADPTRQDCGRVEMCNCNIPYPT